MWTKAEIYQDDFKLSHLKSERFSEVEEIEEKIEEKYISPIHKQIWADQLSKFNSKFGGK